MNQEQLNMANQLETQARTIGQLHRDNTRFRGRVNNLLRKLNKQMAPKPQTAREQAEQLFKGQAK